MLASRLIITSMSLRTTTFPGFTRKYVGVWWEMISVPKLSYTRLSFRKTRKIDYASEAKRRHSANNENVRRYIGFRVGER
jgi:hypothetical protein